MNLPDVENNWSLLIDFFNCFISTYNVKFKLSAIRLAQPFKVSPWNKQLKFKKKGGFFAFSFWQTFWMLYEKATNFLNHTQIIQKVLRTHIHSKSEQHFLLELSMRRIRNYIKILPFNKQNLFIHFFLITSIYTLKISEHWVEIKVRPPTYKTVK